MSAARHSAPARPPSIAERIAALDWARIDAELDERGAATTGALLTGAECAGLARLWDSPGVFRSRVAMARHGFGRGEYRYFAYPLPGPLAQLRAHLYPRLAPLANGWEAALGRRRRFPPEHDAFLRRCRRRGQGRPTPLLLRYGPGDYNCLHQDVYGEQLFPLQATMLLSAPQRDFAGGEFVLVENRARQQSRAEVIALGQGEAVIFAVRERPVRGKRGFHRGRLRHGVSRVQAGERFACGIIFHDAA